MYTTTNNEKSMDPLIEKFKYDSGNSRDPVDVGKPLTNGTQNGTTPHHVRRSYQDAVKALTSLQLFVAMNTDPKNYDIDKAIYMGNYLECVGMTLEDQDRLNVIHIAGTKGKGSTCSYTESILRHKGYKTGFFSSPHLKELRERIRINGSSISPEKFTEYFWHCFDRIQEDCADILPTFFQFLTVLSFYAFWKEKVDVSIIEVGLGGRYDCTNIVKNPIVCGITHLGIDHTNVLGKTIKSIAGHKAGIFKPGTPAVTGPQLEEALEVLQDNAKEIKCSLYMAPDLSTYEDLKDDAEINDYEQFQKENVSLALQLCRIWLHNVNKDRNKRKWMETFSGETIPVLETQIPDADIVIPAVKSTRWAGRLQILKRQNVTYYLDGAHTDDSIRLCSDWFKKKSAAEVKELDPNQKVVKILVFNVTGERNPHNMMLYLKDCGFDITAFTPNTCYADMVMEDLKRLVANLNVTKRNQNKWLELHNGIPDQNGGEEGGDVSNQTPLCASAQESKCPATEIFNSIFETLLWCSRGEDMDLYSNLNTKDIPLCLKEADHIQVLVTGSVYLVGGVLTIFNSTV